MTTAAAALLAGTVGLRQWQREARYRNLWVKTGDNVQKLAFESDANEPLMVSGMWRPVQTGGAKGTYALETDRPFVGRQSQRITFVDGQGQVGVENQGLEPLGDAFCRRQDLRGHLWVRAEANVDLFVALETPDGSQRLAEERLAIKGATGND